MDGSWIPVAVFGAVALVGGIGGALYVNRRLYVNKWWLAIVSIAMFLLFVIVGLLAGSWTVATGLSAGALAALVACAALIRVSGVQRSSRLEGPPIPRDELAWLVDALEKKRFDPDELTAIESRISAFERQRELRQRLRGL